LERHHLEFVLRGHGRLQHHAIKKQKPRTWRGFVSNLTAAFADRSLRCGFFMRAAREAMCARFADRFADRFAPIARAASERASIRAGEARARAVTP
ncbi:hypothetical protein, partial [Burkholderia pseudomallei]